jgi:hypothetical protein
MNFVLLFNFNFYTNFWSMRIFSHSMSNYLFYANRCFYFIAWKTSFQDLLRGVKVALEIRHVIIPQLITPIGSKVMKCDILHSYSHWPISCIMLLFLLKHSHSDTPYCIWPTNSPEVQITLL